MLLLLCLAVPLLLLLRLAWIFYCLGKSSKRSSRCRLLAVVGSGGHTMEMLRLLSELGDRYSPRDYVLAETDKRSEVKIVALESERKRDEKVDYGIHRIPRSREVRQSWLSSVATTITSTLYCFPLLWRLKPDLVLCNGPGTCVPICLVAFFYKVIGLTDAKIVYVESFCRVTSLSLSGKILYIFADSVLVQWPELKNLYPRTIYKGRMI